MQIRIDCPINFMEPDFLNSVFSDKFRITFDDPECIICNPCHKYDASNLDQFHNLKIIATPSTGVNHIDNEYCKSRNIQVYCLLDDRDALENICASAEFTWLHVMNAFRRFDRAIDVVRNQHWRDKEDFLRGRELYGKNLGIIGFGRIGRKVARYADAFGMHVGFYDPYQASYRCEKASLNDIASRSDIICVCAYLTAETRLIIDHDFIRSCRKGTIIVNTSRGELVDEDAICSAVESNQIFYSTDVVCGEQEIDKLWSSLFYRSFINNKNVLITPHISGATIESQTKAFQSIINIVQSKIVQDIHKSYDTQ